MKKTLIFLLHLFFVYYSLLSQDVIWTDHLSSDSELIPTRSIVDKNNNLYILGRFKGILNYGEGVLNSNGVIDIFLTKFNSDGEL
ncbi:MAG: hypothetical protein ACLFUC_08950, partial [Bacteroidales bacterium]